MAKLDLAFQLTANADGVAAGVAQADRELGKVGSSAKATAAEFRQAAKITAEMRTPAEKYADTVAKLDQMMQKGILSQEVYGRAVTKAENEMKAATSSMDDMGRAASMTERVVNGLSGAIKGVGDATKSVADAGVSVIAFGKDVIWTYAQWRVFSAIRNPAGLKDFAIGALKGAMAARTLILAAKALGIGLAVGGGAAGTAAAAVLGLTNPVLSATLLTINLGRAFLDAKDRAYELATGITDGTVALEQLNAELGTVRAQQIDNLAFAMEESTAAASRSEKAFASLSDVFVTPFVGAFAAIQSGLAGLNDGLSSVVEGLAAVFSPIAEAIAPVFTFIGTLVEGVLKLGGVLMDIVGVVLKVAGAFIRVFLSPVIVGLANTVELIRSGMNAAFEFIGSRIDWVSQKVQDFYAFMSKVPVIGGAFAGGGGVGAAGGEGPAAAIESVTEAMESQVEVTDDLTRAIERQEAALSSAINKSVAYGQEGFNAAHAYQEELRRLEAQLEAGILNETSFGQAAEAAREKFDAQIQAIDDRNAAEKRAADEAAKQQEQAAADAARAEEQAAKEQERRQKEAAAIDEKMASKQADIDKVMADRAAALGGKSNEALKANDVRSGEGMAQYLALATGREDPAIAEYRKQTEKLNEIKAELRALQQEKVDILGAAA